MQRSRSPLSSFHRGFSLVEALVTVAVIGVIVSIALVGLDDYREATQDAQRRRNAQNIVGVFEAGRAAGVQWEVSSLDAALKDVTRGKAVETGVLRGNYFAFPEPDAEAVTNAKKYIRLEDGRLTYHP
ncbi:prepilin-type N-terminal cleavage/methylation domain-containing protein [Verrucomicrobium sp. BvORR106]|uniref:prepilin-type N-terminal cleavage/methylation domain-containing protein n=1 Tax=Verrucomicrobium sp. BvORR106 TaxID=1403819 RepID=UPI00056EC9FD|nr:prepilin-type N-terminal cleavage/methylation domain-containing protein [Verrucomicrobium sp. BvORR106]